MSIVRNGEISHTGVVLELHHTIDYEDYQDWYGYVWNENTQSVEVISLESDKDYSNSKEDAPKEIWGKALNWAKQTVRSHRAKKIWERREWEIETAHDCGLTRPQYVRLEKALGKYIYPVRKILVSHKNNRLRSEFRKSLATQVINWINEKNPKYKSPLSQKQIGALIKGEEYLYNQTPDRARAFMAAHYRKCPTPLNRANEIVRRFGLPTFYNDGFDTDEWD